MRLIDADALEELFRAVIFRLAKNPDISGDIEHMIRASATVIEMIQDAPSIEIPSAQQWIPCSERLPEKFGDYLVSVKRHGWNCEEHIENDIAYWDDLEGFHKAEEVLVWMQLPEPYKGEQT